jgi:hypothetical protein
MVYNTQNDWGFRLCPSSGIPKKLEKTIFPKLDPFQSSGEGGGTLLDPVERAKLNHWRTCVSIKGKKKSKAIPVTGRGGP